MELEVLKVRKESNEVHDLSGRADWLSEGKEPECRWEVSKVSLKIRHKVAQYKVIYSKFLEVLEREKVTQVVSIQSLGSETVFPKHHADPESFDKWE
jgi:hypothetical protein